jgi:hypothetical protein
MAHSTHCAAKDLRDACACERFNAARTQVRGSRQIVRRSAPKVTLQATGVPTEDVRPGACEWCRMRGETLQGCVDGVGHGSKKEDQTTASRYDIDAMPSRSTCIQSRMAKPATRSLCPEHQQRSATVGEISSVGLRPEPHAPEPYQT